MHLHPYSDLYWAISIGGDGSKISCYAKDRFHCKLFHQSELRIILKTEIGIHHLSKWCNRVELLLGWKMGRRGRSNSMCPRSSYRNYCITYKRTWCIHNTRRYYTRIHHTRNNHTNNYRSRWLMLSSFHSVWSTKAWVICSGSYWSQLWWRYFLCKCSK